MACTKLTVNAANRLLEKKKCNKMKKTSARTSPPNVTLHHGTWPRSCSYLRSVRFSWPFAQLSLGAVFDRFSLDLFGPEFHYVRPRLRHCHKENVLKGFRSPAREKTDLKTSANTTLTD